MLVSSVSKHPAGHPQRVKSRDRESLRGLGQMGSANSPLAIHCLHDDRRHQLRLYGNWEAFGLDSLFAIASSLLNVDHRSVHVRVAVCRQKARVPNRRIGTTTTVTKAKKKIGSTKTEPPLDFSMRELKSYGMKAI